MKHSKITAIVLTLCMLVTLMVVAPTAASATTDANLVKDGSFEAWGATGEYDDRVWSFEAPMANINSTVGPTASEKYDGNYAYKLSAYKDEDGATVSGRRAVAYKIGGYPKGAIVSVSVMAKVNSIANGYLRLLVRFGDSGETWNNSTGEAFPIQKITAPTDGWVKITTQSTIDTLRNNTYMVVWFESQQSTEFEAYIDDVRVEVAGVSGVSGPTVTNGDFETGDLTGWALSKTGVHPTVETDETGNHYVEFDMGEDNGSVTQEGIKVQLKGLTPGTKYLLTFDLCTSGAFFHLDGAGGTLAADDPGIGALFSSCSTGGNWQGYGIEWTQPAGKTTLWVRFILWGSTGFVQGTDYVRMDNIALTEVDTTNLISNGSFEYGRNGLGYKDNSNGYQGGAYGAYNFVNYEMMTQVPGGMDGRYALKISRPADATSWNGGRKQSGAQYGFAPEVGKTYVYTAYVKNISLVDNADGKAFALMANGPDMGEEVYSAADLPVGEWTCLSFVKTHTSAPVFDLRVYGTGDVLIDNVSCRELTGPVVTYAKANNAVADALVDGSKVTISVPAAAADQGNVYALALYNRNGEKKTLLNVQARTIKAADVTKGYATFTLTAETFGADFANVNYAKLIMLKGGSYDAIQEYDLLLKAAQ